MKSLKYIIMLMVATMVVSTAGAQKSEAEFLQISKAYKLNADGSYEMRCKKEVKLLTQLSFNNLYGETFIVYNPQYQKLTINECYTIQADGKKIEAPSNAFNEVLPSFAANAPAFNHLREMVVTHTGTEVGATIYLDYTLKTVTGYTTMMANEVLQEMSPVNNYAVSVEYPAGTPLYYNQFNCPNPEISKGSDVNKITWTMKNVTAASFEPFQPSDRRELPRVAFTSKNKGSDIILNLAKQITLPSDVIKTKVGKLTETAKTDKEKEETITNFVINNVAAINVPLEYTGYKIRSIDEVYRTAYGTPAEKAVLLAAMLNQAGIKATPIIAMPDWAKEGTFIGDDKMRTEGPGPFFWLSASAEFPVQIETDDNNEYYISPLRREIFTWHDEGKSCYLLKDTKGMPNSYGTNIKGIEINYSYTIGTKDNASTEPKFEMIKKGGYSALTNTSVKINEIADNDNEGKPISVNKNGNYYTINLSDSYVGISSWWGMNALSANPRTTLLEIPFAVDESYTYKLSIPANLEIVNRNTSTIVTMPNNTAVGKVVIDFRVDDAKRTIVVTRSIKLNKTIISPKEYANFKELMDVWFTTTDRMVVLKQTK